MMGDEEPETCWATHKRQVINLWNRCILLVDLFESNGGTNFILWIKDQETRLILHKHDDDDDDDDYIFT
jgi:hypothetical protein